MTQNASPKRSSKSKKNGILSSNAKKIQFIAEPIGKVHADDQKMEYSIEIDSAFRPALKELEKFTHANIIWWGTETDTLKHRAITQVSELPPFYGDNAPTMGIFATRSEYRPNPILITSVAILHVDAKDGIITIPYMDAHEGTPVLDIKPYLPMTDRIMSADYPSYLQHWPKNNEDAAEWWAKQFPQN